MESELEQPQKKRRVTKACDQCRKRRIKCESYPKAALDAPCVICTDADQADQCTYSRPTKKRGPQAGRAKSLQERCEGLERLLGHLLLTIPAVAPHIDTFFLAASSPDSPSTSTSALSTTPEQQQSAFTVSSIPEQLEAMLPAPVPAREAAKSGEAAATTPAKWEATSPRISASAVKAATVDDRPQQPHATPRKVAALPPLPPFPLMAPDPSVPQPPIYPYAPLSSSQPQPQPFPPLPLSTTALQALANAAVPDLDSNREGVATRAGRKDGLEIPTLPDEGVRNQLLDLYFNQIVQPYFPMLDKSLFLRWSAHLPASPSSTTSSLPSARILPPALYLAVFALSSSYLPPSSAPATHSPSVWAEAARAHLWEEVEKLPTVETVGAAVIGALVDWGTGQLNRAWVLSSLALSLSINLSLHLSSHSQPDPNSLKLRTFHSALIIHTLLSLRLGRAPLVVLEDYDVPIPPVDGAENFELWRSDKTTGELREEWGGPAAAGESGGGSTAVRSASLSTFARMASLCAIGLAILRWDVCPRRGYGQSLATGEQERVELVESLRSWEDELEPELRLGDAVGGVERLGERARWTVEMHMVLAALQSRLKPHPSLASSALNPLPHSLSLLTHVLNRYRSLFTLYRSLPTLDAVLHALSTTLFSQSDYAPHQHDAPLRAYEEMGRLWGVARTSEAALKVRVDGHKRELGLLRGVHPTSSAVPPPVSPTAAPAPLPGAEPFQAFLSYSADLGPSAAPSTIVDFASWDQTDLLVSLGLVMGGDGWGLPMEAGGGAGVASAFGVPLPIEGASMLGTETGTSFLGPPPPRPSAAQATEFEPSQMVTSPPSVSSQPFDSSAASLFPTPAPPRPSTLFLPAHPPSYPHPGFFTDPGADGGAGGGQGTDLLTRWLDRGSVGLDGFAGLGGGEEGSGLDS
ncbi:hypothetical protein JCM5296_004783 [Sporobolomyces johnsonii]